MSFAQQRLWFLDQLSPGEATYNVPGMVRLSGAVDVDGLRWALDQIVARHESLRTRFAVVDDAPVQVVEPAARVDIEVTEAPGASEEDVWAWAGERARWTFDLRRGPLFRASMLRIASDEWVLVVVLHHSVSDGWSLGVLLRELSVLYGDYVAGRQPSLPELPIQYADFAVWQREWLEEGVLESQLDYWRSQLSGAPVGLPLPTDRPRTGQESRGGAQLPVSWNAELVDGLRGVARRSGATVYMTVLAAFQVVLGRFAGTEDVVVGSPVAGRTRPELEGLIGFFVNTLVMRTDLSGSPSFDEVLRRVRETALEAYAHQDVPFERLVEELAPPRDAGRTPLFQVMFVLQNAPMGQLELGDADVRASSVSTGTAKFELTLSLEEVAGGVEGYLEYDTSLFDADTAQRLIAALEQVLAAVVEDSSRPVGLLPLLPAPEYRRVIEEWNDTTRPLPETTVHGLFEQHARACPDDIALVGGTRRLTYGELNRKANRLAHHLLDGTAPETPIALYLTRSIDTVVAMLGVLKAGCAYVPLDMAAPAERLRFVIENSGAAVLVTHDELRGRLPETDVPIITLDDVEGTAETDPVPFPAVSQERLAYIMYTSGSTGRPKGVSVPHRAVVRLALSTEHVRITPEDTTLYLAPASFDAATFEIWAGLLNGARVAVADSDPLDLDELPRILREHGVTTLWLTAQLFHQVVEHDLDALSGIRNLLAGGDVLAPAHVRAVRERFPECRMINGYGPTENTTFTCCEVVSDVDGETPVPIGGPIANTRVYVLDEWLEPVPVGVFGELFVAGRGLARGYVGDGGLTAERFVPDPFGDGGRLYRTGDVVRWLPDGRLEFAGRVDHQVKIRGHRVELGEIESVLQRCPGVGQAVVVLREDIGGGPRLIGYVTGEGLNSAELSAWVGRSLPGYMVPSAVIVLEKFPVTPNGKVDRAGLPAPEREDVVGAGFAAPRGPVEQAVAEVWGGVLGLDQVGIHDDFFALGGHSLLATQIVTRLRETFGVAVSLRELFERPTVAALAELVTGASGREQAPPIPVADRNGPLPLSFAQQRLWFLDQLSPGEATYNVPGMVRLSGAVDLDGLRWALDQVVMRHESLRTRFAGTDDAPVQVVETAGRAGIEVAEELGASEEYVREWARRQARRSFDLQRGPLFRVSVLRVAPDEWLLVVVLHHSVSDGWSLGVLLRELSVLYGDYVAGRQSSLPELPVQYADFAVWQREWLDGDVLESQLEYWRSQLSGAPAGLSLPTDRPRTGQESRGGAQLPVSWDAEFVEGVRGVARRSGATVYMTVLAAFQVVLGRFAGTEDVVVGSPVAGRTRPELEGLIGFFVNTLVMRTDLSGSPSFDEVLRRVRETSLEAYAHQDVPFERLVEDLAPPRDVGRTPLFQVMFVLQNAPAGDLELNDVEVQALPVSTATAKFELTLSLGEVAGGIEGYLEYDTGLFDPGTAQRLITAVEQVLAAVIADPARPVKSLPLMPASELRRVTEEWNDTARPIPHNTVHELFEQHAQAHPDDTALVQGADRLSYDELNRKANRLAHQLLTRTAPETAVGILLDTSAETAISVLGAWKAGCAYVPLEPGFPDGRIRQMLADADVRVVLTRGSLADRVDTGVPVVRLDEVTEALKDYPDTNPARVSDPRHPAYIIYTSGSTGTPKGVVVEHRNATSYLVGITERFRLEPGDHYGLLQPLAVDSCLTVLIPALGHGGTLHVLGRDQSLDPDAVLEHFRRHPIDVLKIAPSHLAALLDAVPSPDLLPRKILALGGEASQWDWIRGTVAPLAGEDAEVSIHYGPTETTVGVLTNPVDPDEVPRGPLVPLGRPIANARVHVLDQAGEPVPVGVFGDIHIGGATVARGYLNRPDLTAERFVPDPFGDGERLYRTGDLGRRLPDGRLEFAGRIDHQVKIRGYRIELGEIEAVLERHESVRQAVVVARESVRGDKELVAYVVPGETAECAEDELRRFLEYWLPAHMVPGAVVVLAALPLGPQGKVDLRALPEPGPARDAEPSREPRNQVERQLAEIWEEALGTAPIGIDDDFFALGGHSLLAVRMMGLVRDRLDAAVPLAALFRKPTIAHLASMLEEVGTRQVLVPVRDEGSGPPLFCVHPVGGEVLCYAELARALERRLIAVQAPEETSATTIEQLAKLYAEEIRRAQPSGPYFLAGWSMGGLLAFEMAGELNRQGEEVGLLALLDTHVPPAHRASIAGHDELPVLSRFAADALRLANRDVDDLQDLDPLRLADILENAGISSKVDTQRLLDVFTRNSEAVAQHRLRPTDQRIVLFQSAEGNSGLARQWGPWAGSVDSHIVPGDHYSMLRPPQVHSLAELLRHQLDQAVRDCAGPQEESEGA
ncbi:amino acid adenylation domain-containing protein [Saccharopolyspora taberi]|uniref:amino acid adenylation domain-containing protein n=1 Tax=Saccharopolyspora taberi TaxID=60895 RepID=UPI0031E21FD5